MTIKLTSGYHFKLLMYSHFVGLKELTFRVRMRICPGGVADLPDEGDLDWAEERLGVFALER